MNGMCWGAEVLPLHESGGAAAGQRCAVAGVRRLQRGAGWGAQHPGRPAASAVPRPQRSLGCSAAAGRHRRYACHFREQTLYCPLLNDFVGWSSPYLILLFPGYSRSFGETGVCGIGLGLSCWLALRLQLAAAALVALVAVLAVLGDEGLLPRVLPGDFL